MDKGSNFSVRDSSELLNTAVSSQLAIEGGADAADSEGQTTLHHAAQYGHADVVVALLDSGARADAADSRRARALTPPTATAGRRCTSLLRTATQA